jgi:ribosome-associated protein
MNDMGTIHTPNGVAIPERALRFTFVRSGGPGGQHVNTSSTKVQVQIGIDACDFDDAMSARLKRVFGKTVLTSASNSRSQWKNKEEALRRALVAIDDALKTSRRRVPTKVTARANERRLKNKARRARQKAERHWSDD